MDKNKLKAAALAATPGIWEWWTSNSFMRLTAQDGPDGGVLCGAKLSDGTGTVVIKPEDAAHIEASCPAAVLELLADNADQAEEILTLTQALTIRGQNADRDKLEIGRLNELLRKIGSGEIMAQMALLEQALRITQLQVGGAHMETARVVAGGVQPEADIRSAALAAASVGVDIDNIALAAATKIMALTCYTAPPKGGDVQLKEQIQCAVRDAMNAYRPLAPRPAKVQEAATGNPRDWLMDGSLLYRLGDDGANCDEINVTMVHGSRGALEREAAAAGLLCAICASDCASSEVPPLPYGSMGGWLVERKTYPADDECKEITNFHLVDPTGRKYLIYNIPSQAGVYRFLESIHAATTPQVPAPGVPPEYQEKVRAAIVDLFQRMEKSYSAEPTRRITFMDIEAVFAHVAALGLGGCLDAAAAPAIESAITAQSGKEQPGGGV